MMNLMIFFLISHAVVVFDAFFIVDLMMSMMRYAVFLVVMALYLKRPSITRFDFLWCIFLFYLITTTILGDGILVSVIGPAIDISLLMMLFHVYPDDGRQILKSTTIALSFYAYMNLLLLFLYPNGLWIDPISGKGYYLLGGNYNGMGARFVMALVTNLMICKDSTKAKLNFVCLLAVSLFSVLFVHSMTSTVSILLLLGLWIAARMRKRKLLMISFFALYMFIQSFVVFMLTDLSDTPYVANFIENTLHKNLTFTHRTVLWENSNRMISESPWLGYGYHDKVWNAEHMDGPGSHNFVYTILLYGGFPLLAIFITLVIAALRHSSDYLNDKRFCQLILGITTLFFMMIFEYYTFFIIAYLVCLIYYYPQLVPKEDE